MSNFNSLSGEEKKELLEALLSRYNEYKSKGLSLDLSRGKPNSEQLDISQGLLSVPMTKEQCVSEAGLDCRNYGVVDGLPEMKKLFSEVFGLDPNYIMIGGNSSLQLMYDTLMRAFVFGLKDSPRPWGQEAGLKWICVTPGYDRHFRITELLGFELISVPMTKDGPDMELVESLARDPKVKGIWCIPKYSNPSGNTYSDETVRRLVKMECGAPDFRIMWDNAYAIHVLSEESDSLLDIFAAARECGNEDRVFYYTSTSKVTFPGAGVALMAASPENKKQILKYLSAQTIGYDKLNQLRHLHYFKNKERVHEHMMKLGALIGKKFKITLDALKPLREEGIAEWTEPRGGYFITLNVIPGTAKRVFDLMKACGVTLTDVGATHPYGVDPEDKTIRLAPTYPSDADLTLATEILALSVRIAALEKLI